jgi:diadenosine tetraphosphate (Ap4A) HIT family hydrolase
MPGNDRVESATVLSMPFTLHPQLERDTVPVCDLALSRVLLMNDANYPWLILVPRRESVVEIVDLAEDDRQQLMGEIARASSALKAVTECEKLNVAAIGNMVPQLHVHVVARRHSDPVWPKPVWGALPPAVYDAGLRDGLIASLYRRLAI